MLRGDLTVETSEALLSDLAQQEATGCLVIEEPAQQGTGDAQIHFRSGKIYAAALPGGTFLVGTRLTTSFGLGSDALGEALEAQRAELHGWRLGEILVHLGHVDAQAVDAISREQVLEIIAETCGWRSGGWRFRAGDRTRAMLSQPIDVPGMLIAIAERQREWQSLQETLGSPDAAIVASSNHPRPTQPLELAAFLRMVDTRGAEGLRSCSHATGLSLLEGARLAVTAFADGSLRHRAGFELVGMSPTEPAPATVTTAAADAATTAIRPVSHALACLLALAGPAAARPQQPAPEPVLETAMTEATKSEPAASALLVPEPTLAEPPDLAVAAEPETVATVLDLTAARAARAVEQSAVEQSAIEQSTVEQSAIEQSAVEQPATENAAIETAAAVAARKEAFAPAFIVPAPREQTKAATQEDHALRREPPQQEAPAHVLIPNRDVPSPDVPARDVSARDVPARDVKVLAEQVERARQSQLDAEDADALQMASALRAAAEVHAQREANARRALPAAFTAPVPTAGLTKAVGAPASKSVPAWTRPLEPAAGPASTWGQGFLSMTPPRAGDSSPGRDPQADTASLMRELTSLGRSDESNDVAPRSAPRQAQFRSGSQLSAPAASAAPEKKRKSFFGR